MMSRADLVQLEILVLPGKIAGNCISQSRHQCGPQNRKFIGNRIENGNRIAQRAVRRQSQTVKEIRMGKAERQSFIEPLTGHNVPRLIHGASGRRRSAGVNRAYRPGRRNIVIAKNSRHFLGDVHRTRNILSPGRRRHSDRIAGNFHRELQFFQNINHRGRWNLGAQITIDPVGGEVELGRQHGPGVYIDHPGNYIAGAHIHQQLRGPLQSQGNRGDIHTALKAAGCLRTQSQAPRCPADVGAVKRGGLQ